jgi:hypothetical protein
MENAENVALVEWLSASSEENCQTVTVGPSSLASIQVTNGAMEASDCQPIQYNTIQYNLRGGAFVTAKSGG